MQILSVQCGDTKVMYYSLAIACKIISANRWAITVDGIHSESLRRSYRDSGHGLRIGRDIFFTEQNLKDMGYEVLTDKYHIADSYVVELGVQDGN
jgi:hypothetical protein